MRLMRCVPCLAFLFGIVCMGWTLDVLASNAGPLGEISAEAIFGGLLTAALLVVSGYTARNDRDMRELRQTMQAQFGAVSTEQRQQQAQINLLVDKFGDRPSRQELAELRAHIDLRFDRLERHG